MHRLLLLPTLAILLAGQCIATDAAPAVAGPTAAMQAPPPSAARLRAAEELLRFMKVEAQVSGTVGAMVDAMTQGQPKLAPYRDVLIDWAGSFMTWENFGPRIAAIYAQAFTEAELHDLLAFYRTPTGQKALSILPDLAKQGAQLGVDLAREHGPDLERRLRTRTAELTVPSKSDAPPAKP